MEILNKNEILMKKGNTKYVFNKNSILELRADRRYTDICLTGGRTFTSNKGIGECCSLINNDPETKPMLVTRIGKSLALNLNYDFEFNDKTLVLKFGCGKEVLLTAAQVKTLNKLLKKDKIGL